MRRKMKLLNLQAKGKERMRTYGKIETCEEK